MAQPLSSNEINKLCANLVYQVAYAFYDTPYIIILKMMVHDNVTTEMELANKIGLTSPEVRKYMGTLHMHRLVRRHVNKEKVPIPEWRLKQLAAQPEKLNQPIKPGQPKPGAIDKDGKPLIIERERTKDVHYWYLDYREFANVVKYRLAIMRKGIDDKIKQEVGHRGYICPLDGKTYDPLDLSNIFDPFTNTFKCEDCQTELIEHDPSTALDGKTTTSQDAMQRFNIATSPIREALKLVEAQTVPSLNIIVWISQNIKTTVKGNGELDEQNNEKEKKFEVVIGKDENEEKEKERLAQQQREQNALPHWYTHSTVTGQATTLGIADQKRKQILAERNKFNENEKEFQDESLKAHYEILDENEQGEDEFEETPTPTIEKEIQIPSIKIENAIDMLEDDEDDEEGMEDISSIPNGINKEDERGRREGNGQMVNVAGIPKNIEDVTDDDYELMSTEEYEAYAQAMYG
ncbi:uncharacterized protein I206_100365 [Kwoniella pini CBS 10737]|uniref:Transcription initiation factor TFIIE subunit alpha n=1 Tax=Kwoniella pini CBS 10737 TaxID=1296096 RepID=A0A1B9IE05_9TREE|nr:transcription initiation factor TFIIE subunit alpha [Kwoniella pini CBS 10737]OCF53654.1 transcription initiation factor TFIIE subunit alpha [Kwoniella pini CBS 10737]